MSQPIFQIPDRCGWFFYDDVGRLVGPFDTEAEAQKELDKVLRRWP